MRQYSVLAELQLSGKLLTRFDYSAIHCLLILLQQAANGNMFFTQKLQVQSTNFPQSPQSQAEVEILPHFSLLSIFNSANIGRIQQIYIIKVCASSLLEK